jgi:hypothetical protein
MSTSAALTFSIEIMTAVCGYVAGSGQVRARPCARSGSARRGFELALDLRPLVAGRLGLLWPSDWWSF